MALPLTYTIGFIIYLQAMSNAIMRLVSHILIFSIVGVRVHSPGAVILLRQRG